MHDETFDPYYEALCNEPVDEVEAKEKYYDYLDNLLEAGETQLFVAHVVID